MTLIELVAATAIFALVALMATQALTGGLIQRRGLDRAEADGAALIRLLALLRQDLDSAVPLPRLPAGGAAEPPFDPDAGGAGFALSRAGPDSGLWRVRWRLDANSGTLWRQAVPLVGAAPPAVPEMPVAEGVTGLRLTPLGEWDPGRDGLPPGFEAVVETRRHGTLRLVVAR